jgi:hypothetical protein
MRTKNSGPLITERNTESGVVAQNICVRRCSELLPRLAEAARLGQRIDDESDSEVLICLGEERSKWLGLKACGACVVSKDDERIEQAVIMGAEPYAARDIFTNRTNAQPLGKD